MSSHSKSSSEQVRARHAKWLRNRTGRANGTFAEGVLTAPTIPDFWPGEPAFASYVPRAQQEVDMQLEIPSWPNGAPDAGETDTLTIEWKRAADTTWGTVHTQAFPGPAATTPVPVALDKVNFSDAGTYNLRYRILNWNNQDNSSATVNIIIDKLAPNFGGQEPDAPTFKDPSLITDGITEEYLAANGDKITVLIPPYNDEQPGDKVELFIFGENPDPVNGPVFSDAIDTTLREADIPGARIKNLPDGHLFVEYHLIDKVGNIGAHSRDTSTELFVKPLPVPPLEAPKVPLAEDAETLIDLEDVRNPGVQVTIARYTNWLSIDNIEVDWGGFKFTHPVGTAPENPMLIPVDYDTVLKPAYGAGTTGQKSTVISYEVVRGSKRFASDPLTINVDLSVAGPPNPDEPDPINPDLDQVTVRGTGASPADNVLNADDIGLPATASVVIYDGYATGHRMSLYWGSLIAPVATYDPQNADAPDKVVTFNIPWAEIEKEPGKTDLPVYYTVGFIAGGNTQRCEDQLVDVTGALPIEFATPEFPDHDETSGGRPILNCSSYIPPDHHVKLKIPGNNPLLTGGESVVVTWQAYSDFAGTVVAGTAWTNTRIVTPAEAMNGYDLQVEPYADHIEPVGSYGSVRVTYTATVAGSPVSGSAHIWASSTSSGGACVITP